MAHQFEELDLWKTARHLANTIYDLTDEGAFSRDFGLKDQIRRASVSVMSNVAEGFESQTDRLFRLYLGRAKASAGEVRAQLYLALDRSYISREDFDAAAGLSRSASRQCYRLSRYLDKSSKHRDVNEPAAEYFPRS